MAVYIVSGKTDELSGASAYIDHLHWTWLTLAVLLELGSILAYAALQGRLLVAGDVRVRMTPLTGITLAGLSIQNSLPGGLVFSSVFAFRQYNHRGADEVLSGWTLVAATVLSQLTLVVLAGIGLGAAGSAGNAYDLAGVLLALVLLTMVLVAVWTQRRPVLRALSRPLRVVQRVIGRPAGDPRQIMEQLADRMTAVTPRTGDWLLASTWAMSNWVLDAACLVAAFLAVGAPVPWRALPLAYGAGQLAANLPITPGGLGVVEGSLTIALVAYGGGRASTVAAVIIYRLISYWALLPPGWLSWGWCNWSIRRAAAISGIGPTHLADEAAA